MHLADPVAQAVEDHPPYDRMVGIERVAGAGVVGIVATIRPRDVICPILDAAKAERGPGCATLGRVVKHDIQNDLNAGSMQCLDHVAELIERSQRILTRTVSLVRSEETDRRIAPVVGEAWRAILGIELEYRQQFDRRDPEVLKIRDLLDQAGIRAAPGVAEARTRVAGEASHMHLINDGLRRRPAQGLVSFPVVGGGIDHHALHCHGGVVTRLGGRLAVIVRWNHHPAAIRIQQHLCRVKAHSPGRIGRPVHTVGIELAGLHAAHACMPIVVGPVDVRFQLDDSAGGCVTGTAKEQQLDVRGGS